jgi:hypothetical protein
MLYLATIHASFSFQGASSIVSLSVPRPFSIRPFVFRRLAPSYCRELKIATIRVISQMYWPRKFTSVGAEFVQGSIAADGPFMNLTSACREIVVLEKTPVSIQVLAESRRKVARAGATESYHTATPQLIVKLGLIAGPIAFEPARHAGTTGSLALFC